MIFNSKNKIQKRSLGNVSSQKEKGKFSRFLFYLLVFFFAAVSAYAFLFSPFLQIKKIYIRGLEELEYEKVMESVRSVVDGKYWDLIKKDNILLIRSRELEKNLLDRHKKIRSVEIKIIFPETLVVSVDERQALLVWCSAENCHMVDEKGMAYAQADFDSPEIAENNLFIIRDQSRSPVLNDQPVISGEIVDFLVAIQQGLRSRLDLEIEREFETPKSISGDISATTKEGWKMKLNKDLGAAKEIQMLQIALEQTIDKDKREKLEYVDLRTEDKVYYKLKNTDPVDPSEEKEEQEI